MSKLISEFKIGFGDETKAEINALKGKLDKVAHAMSAKNESHADGLLAAMQAVAANDDQPELKKMDQWVFEGLNEKYQSAAMDDDGAVFAYECLLEDLVKNTDDGLGYWYSRTGADSVHVCTLSDGSNWEHFAIQRQSVNDAPEPELLELGQWVFEGQDEKWISASVDEDGTGVLHNDPKERLEHDMGQWYGDREHKRLVDVVFDATNWTTSPIDRETVNDVDYLTCEGAKTKGMASFIAIDEYDSLSDSAPHIDDVLAQPNWLSDSVPQITQADMQLIFIKNLSNVLIQRMQTMDRFSDDDYHIGGTNLMPWDIVTGEYNDKVVYSVVAGTQAQADRDTNKIDIVRLKPKFLISENHVSIGAITSIYFDSNDSFCTITEDELPAFREALEACYA